MIENLIQTLFYINTRIIIPNFGAFLPNGLDEHGNCKFIFTPNLKFNDGFLVRRLVEGENLSYAEAQAQIELFIHKVQNELQFKKMALLPDFGGFYYDNKNTLHFLLEKDMEVAHHKIQHIIKNESKGTLMDVRLDEFVLSKPVVHEAPTLQDVTPEETLKTETFLDLAPPLTEASKQVSTPLPPTLPLAENITHDSSYSLDDVTIEEKKKTISQDDFFDLSSNQTTPSKTTPEEHLRKVKEVELLQKQLEALEKTKREYLEKIKKEEEERLALLAQQKVAEETVVAPVEKPLAPIEQPTPDNIPPQEIPHAVEPIKSWQTTATDVNESKTPQKIPTWRRAKSVNNPNTAAIFTYRGSTRHKRRDILPILLITLLLLVIFSTAGFLYFREEITGIFSTKHTVSRATDNQVIDLQSSSKSIYHIVIQSFTKKSEAQRYLQAVKTKNPTIEPQILPQPGNLYFISIYRYNNEREADAVINKLKNTIPNVKKIVQN